MTDSGLFKHPLSNLGVVYVEMQTGDRATNLQKAIANLEAALRVMTKKDFPVEWARIQSNLGWVYFRLPDGNREENLKIAKTCCEAALSVYTENDFPNEYRKADAILTRVNQELRKLTSE
jgi:hypothetical protein